MAVIKLILIQFTFSIFYIICGSFWNNFNRLNEVTTGYVNHQNITKRSWYTTKNFNTFLLINSVWPLNYESKIVDQRRYYQTRCSWSQTNTNFFSFCYNNSRKQNKPPIYYSKNTILHIVSIINYTRRYFLTARKLAKAPSKIPTKSKTKKMTKKLSI